MPQGHPLRVVRKLTNTVLRPLSTIQQRVAERFDLKSVGDSIQIPDLRSEHMVRSRHNLSPANILKRFKIKVP